MKIADEIIPTYAPVYAAALYPKLCKIFQKHGYALAVHGSVATDFDLIAVPWAKKVSKPDVVLKAMTDVFDIHLIGKPTKRNHKRVAYAYNIGFDRCSLDLSFFPLIT